jgi:Lar family restriction alleviation protein
METVELKRCPFCGNTPRIEFNKVNQKSILYGVLCDDEHHTASVGYFESVDEAIENWNRRADDE